MTLWGAADSSSESRGQGKADTMSLFCAVLLSMPPWLGEGYPWEGSGDSEDPRDEEIGIKAPWVRGLPLQSTVSEPQFPPRV